VHHNALGDGVRNGTALARQTASTNDGEDVVCGETAGECEGPDDAGTVGGILEVLVDGDVIHEDLGELEWGCALCWGGQCGCGSEGC